MKIINSILHSKAKASHFKVKNINIYFETSIDKGFKYINLENIDFLEMYINESNNIYELLAVLSKNNEDTEVSFGKFNSKIDAEKAFDKIKNELYGTGKSILTILNTVLLTLIYIILISFLLSGNKTNSVKANPNMPTMQSNADLSEIQKQMLNNALKQIPQTAQSGMPSSKVINPQEINNLINKAINDAQNQNNSNNQTNVATGQNVENNTKPNTDDILNNFK